MSKYSFAFAILTAFLLGLAPQFAKLGLDKINPLAGVTLRSIGITTVLVTVLFASGKGKELMQIDLKTASFIITGGILAGAIGHWTYFRALKYGEVSRVVPIVGSYPLFAFLLSLLLLGEKLTLGKGLGVVLIVLGIFLLR